MVIINLNSVSDFCAICVSFRNLYTGYTVVSRFTNVSNYHTNSICKLITYYYSLLFIKLKLKMMLFIVACYI